MRWGRTLTLALPLLVLNAGWIAHSEMRTGVTEITITTLFMGVALVLFLLTLLNQGVRRLFPRAALRPAEMFCLYVLLTIGTSVAGIGNFGFFAPFLVGIWRYGPERSWERLYDTLPERVLGPGDPARLFWGVFFTLLCSVTLCLAFLLRRRWADEEYLTFPVVALPLRRFSTHSTRSRVSIRRCPSTEGTTLQAFFRHLGNVSYKLGRKARFADAESAWASDEGATEALVRMRTHLSKNEVAIETLELTLGPKVFLDGRRERTKNRRAAPLLTREYRKGFELPR